MPRFRLGEPYMFGGPHLLSVDPLLQSECSIARRTSVHLHSPWHRHTGCLSQETPFNGAHSVYIPPWKKETHTRAIRLVGSTGEPQSGLKTNKALHIQTTFLCTTNRSAVLLKLGKMNQHTSKALSRSREPGSHPSHVLNDHR